MTTKGAPALIPAQKGRRLKRVMGVTYACDRGYDACSWVVGISSAGLFGAAYARVTEELTRVWTCALLDKPSRRVVGGDCDFTGFVIPDVFVVGYGIDYAEKYRHLPYIGRVG